MKTQSMIFSMVVLCCFAGCRPEEDSNQSALGGFKSPAFEPKEWTSYSGDTLKLISPTEAEFGRPGQIVLGQYSKEGKVLRLVLPLNGTSRVSYFDIIDLPHHPGDKYLVSQANRKDVYFEPKDMVGYIDKDTEQSMFNARRIVLACKAYGAKHDGNYPDTLETLVREGIVQNDQIFHDPLLHDDTQIGYQYLGQGMKISDPPSKVVLVGKAKNTAGRRVVALNDSSVEMRKSDQ